ncbi:MAG TPA: efflux RND transporter periplasmic adaptor subunit [Longimicrobiales bacterium]|nr:efflux RND transporter periplasmic adaptor subunit [Longimicrobiales bacterium]
MGGDSKKRRWIGSAGLLGIVLVVAGGLTAWKTAALEEAAAAASGQPEPTEFVTAAVAAEEPYRKSTTAIGTVLALRSISLRNEVAGVVRQVSLSPGAVVEAGDVLVALDVSVEEAELEAQRAEAALAETTLARLERLLEDGAASREEVDQARAERDVAVASVERTQALIERKTIRAPFRARVGIADVHRGQYLTEGTLLTTLQGLADTVHVDFAVSQYVAADLHVGDSVTVVGPDERAIPGEIEAIDSRIDPETRNAIVRARVIDGASRLSPGASVRVEVPVGASRQAVTIPVSALRKGPSGDHVFVLEPDAEGKLRAHSRRVRSGPVSDGQVVIFAGLSPGEQVADQGSFKLREAALVALAEADQTAAGGAQ